MPFPAAVLGAPTSSPPTPSPSVFFAASMTLTSCALTAHLALRRRAAGWCGASRRTRPRIRLVTGTGRRHDGRLRLVGCRPRSSACRWPLALWMGVVPLARRLAVRCSPRVTSGPLPRHASHGTGRTRDGGAPVRLPRPTARAAGPSAHARSLARALRPRRGRGDAALGARARHRLPGRVGGGGGRVRDAARPRPSGSTVSDMWGPITDVPSGAVGRLAQGHRWGTHDAVLGPLVFGALAIAAAGAVLVEPAADGAGDRPGPAGAELRHPRAGGEHGRRQPRAVVGRRVAAAGAQPEPGLAAVGGRAGRASPTSPATRSPPPASRCRCCGSSTAAG